MEIYNNAGEHVRTQEFDLRLHGYFILDKDTPILFIIEEECLIMSASGITKI